MADNVGSPAAVKGAEAEGGENREDQLEQLASDIQLLTLEDLSSKYPHLQIKKHDLIVCFLTENERDVMFEKGLQAAAGYITARNSRSLSGKSFVAPQVPEEQAEEKPKEEEKTPEIRQLEEDVDSLAYTELCRKYCWTKTSNDKIIFCLTIEEAKNMHNYALTHGTEALLERVDKKHVRDLPPNLRASNQQESKKQNTNHHRSRSVNQRKVTWMAQFPRSKTVSHSTSSGSSSIGTNQSSVKNNNSKKDNEVDTSYDSDATITGDEVFSRDSTVSSGFSGYASAMEEQSPKKSATTGESIKIHNPGDADVVFSLIEGLKKNDNSSFDWADLVAKLYKFANELPSDKKIDNLLERVKVLKRRLLDMTKASSSNVQTVEDIFNTNAIDINPLKRIVEMYFELADIEDGNVDEFVRKNIKFEAMQERRSKILKTVACRKAKCDGYIDDPEMIIAAYELVTEESKLSAELSKKVFVEVSPHLNALKKELVNQAQSQKMQEGPKVMESKDKKRIKLTHEFAETFFKHLDGIQTKQQRLNEELSVMCLESQNRMKQESIAHHKKTMTKDDPYVNKPVDEQPPE